MTNKDKIKLYGALVGLNVKGVKFNYAVAKNISILEKEVESLKASLKTTPEYDKYDEQRVELAKKHAEKDQNGEAIIKDKNYYIKDSEKFEKEFDKLKKENSKVVEEREKQIEDYNKLLDEDSTIELHKIAKDDLSEELTTQQLFGIIEIVEE